MKCLYWSSTFPNFEPELVEVVGPHAILSKHMPGWITVRYAHGIKEGDEKSVLASELYCEGEEARLADDMQEALLHMERIATDSYEYFKQLEFVGVPAQRKWINKIAKGDTP